MRDLSPIILDCQIALEQRTGTPLSHDGIAGPQTWRAIIAELNLGIPNLAARDIPQAAWAAEKFLSTRRDANGAPLYAGALDGIPGPLFWGALRTYLGADDSHGVPVPPPVPITPPAEGEVDERSAHALATLHPHTEPLATRVLVQTNARLAALGIHAVITSATRTYAEQSELYAQGRTAPGPVVTNAPAGFSNHNFGLAFDITLFRGSAPLWDSPLYAQVYGPIVRDNGLTWGGDWTGLVDEPHAEDRPAWAKDMGEGAMLAELRTRKAQGRDIFA